MFKLFDKIKASFSFKGNKIIQKNSGGGDNINGKNITVDKSSTTYHSSNNYIDELDQKIETLILLGKGDGITHGKFNDTENTYEFAKRQHPTHPSIETFGLIAVEYYTQKIKQAEEKGENTLAYERVLARYTTNSTPTHY